MTREKLSIKLFSSPYTADYMKGLINLSNDFYVIRALLYDTKFNKKSTVHLKIQCSVILLALGKKD